MQHCPNAGRTHDRRHRAAGFRPSAAIYPGDTPLVVERAQERTEHLPNVSKLVCSVHAGIHVDAPVHFLDNPDGIESVPVETLIVPTWLVDAGQRRLGRRRRSRR